MLAGILVSINVSAGGWVTLSADDYQLWPGTYTSNVIRLQLVGDAAKNIIDPGNCAVENASSYYLQATLDKDVISRSYALILAAKMSKTSLNFFINGCEGEFPAIQSIRL